MCSKPEEPSRYHCFICKKNFNSQEELSFDVYHHHMSVLPQVQTNGTFEVRNYQAGMNIGDNTADVLTLMQKVIEEKTKMYAMAGIEKPENPTFTCAICNEAFYFGFELVHHFIVHMCTKEGEEYANRIFGLENKGKIPFLADVLNKPLEEQPCAIFSCDVCKFNFRCLQLLTFHLLTHPHKTVLNNIRSRHRRNLRTKKRYNNPYEAVGNWKESGQVIIRQAVPSADYNIAFINGKRMLCCKMCPKTYLKRHFFEAHRIAHHTAKQNQQRAASIINSKIQKILDDIQKNNEI